MLYIFPMRSKSDYSSIADSDFPSNIRINYHDSADQVVGSSRPSIQLGSLRKSKSTKDASWKTSRGWNIVVSGGGLLGLAWQISDWFSSERNLDLRLEEGYASGTPPNSCRHIQIKS